MTIDQRLEKLADRHEALTQSVELMSNEINTLKTVVREVVDGISDLVKIVRSHEQRLSNLEES